MTANMLNILHENDEEDYYKSLFFPVEVQNHLQPLLEHRIKLLLKHTIISHAGESQNVETSSILDDRKTQTKLCLILKQYEHLHVTLKSVGNISSRFKGRIEMKLTNYSCENITSADAQ